MSGLQKRSFGGCEIAGCRRFTMSILRAVMLQRVLPLLLMFFVLREPAFAQSASAIPRHVPSTCSVTRQFQSSRFVPTFPYPATPRRRSFFGLARISSGRFCLLAECGRVCLMTKPVSVHSGTNLSSRHFLPSMMQEFATMTRTYERLALYFHIFIYIFSWQLACI